MTILLTGGTGKTGRPLARLLKDANQPFLIATRSPEKLPEAYQGQGVKFDWYDTTTHENPFKADANIDRVYLVGVGDVDMLTPMKPWIDLAVSRGVKRIVVLSATVLESGGLLAGAIHKYVTELGIDYCVLRPTWFFENFATLFYSSIREQNEIATTAGDGRVPLVSVDDIAKVAFKALVDEKSHNTDHIIVGPELVTYNKAAEVLSEVLGRKITHRKQSHAEAKEEFMSLGFPEDFVGTYLTMVEEIATGREELTFYKEVKVVGETHLRDYLQANRAIWIKE